jgi:hypothetical protein
MDRTSARPEINLNLLQSIYFKLGPLTIDEMKINIELKNEGL